MEILLLILGIYMSISVLVHGSAVLYLGVKLATEPEIRSISPSPVLRALPSPTDPFRPRVEDPRIPVEYPVPRGIKEIKVSGNLECILHVGISHSLKITMDRGSQGSIKVLDGGDLLIVSVAGTPPRPLKVEIGIPTLRNLDVGGAARVSVRLQRAQKSIEVHAEGNSTITLRGIVEKCRMAAHGAAIIDASSLWAHRLDAFATHASTIRAFVNGGPADVFANQESAVYLGGVVKYLKCKTGGNALFHGLEAACTKAQITQEHISRMKLNVTQEVSGEIETGFALDLRGPAVDLTKIRSKST